MIVTDINPEAGVAVAAEIGGTAQVCDMANRASVKALRDVALAIGAVEIVVSNAGVTYLQDATEGISETDFGRIFG